MLLFINGAVSLFLLKGRGIKNFARDGLPVQQFNATNTICSGKVLIG
jgi:hypothetical protein